MKKLIDGLNVFYSENVRLVKTLIKRESPDEYPELLKWKLQILYFDGNDWIEICRIDNYEKQKGPHIHMYKKEEVRKIHVTFKGADKVIKEVSRRILKDCFNKIVEFE